MWAVFEFCKTLLSDKIRKRFTVLSNVEKLKTKLGTEILPTEYGGIESVDEMSSKWVQEVAAQRNNLLELDQMTVCETAMIKKSKEKKSSLWSIFGGYGSQATAESL